MAVGAWKLCALRLGSRHIRLTFGWSSKDRFYIGAASSQKPCTTDATKLDSRQRGFLWHEQGRVGVTSTSSVEALRFFQKPLCEFRTARLAAASRRARYPCGLKSRRMTTR
jgi:hypothetical protein